MRYLLMLAFIMLLSALPARAQPDPDHPQPEPREQRQAQAQAQPLALAQNMLHALLPVQRTQLCLTPQGVFVLRNGVLARLNADTLATEKTVELFGPLPERQVAAENQGIDRQWLAEAAKRLLPAAILVRENDVLAVVGEQYFRVDIATMEVKVNVALGNPFAPNPLLQDLMRMRENTSEPSLTLHDKMLYVALPDKVVSVKIADGEVLARGSLPAKMQAQPLALLPPAAPMGRNQNNPRDIPINNAPKVVTLVGTLLRHTEQGGCWTVKTPENEEYALGGEKLAAITREPNVIGHRIRLTGNLTPDPRQFVIGVVEITQFQLLTE